MRSNRLRHKIEIQERSTTPDSHGQPVDTWAEYLTVRASIEPLMGRELYAAQQINAEVTSRIRIRYRAGITAAMRVLWGSRIYNILAVINPREENKELLLTCSEGLSDG